MPNLAHRILARFKPPRGGFGDPKIDAAVSDWTRKIEAEFGHDLSDWKLWSKSSPEYGWKSQCVKCELRFRVERAERSHFESNAIYPPEAGVFLVTENPSNWWDERQGIPCVPEAVSYIRGINVDLGGTNQEVLAKAPSEVAKTLLQAMTNERGLGLHWTRPTNRDTAEHFAFKGGRNWKTGQPVILHATMSRSDQRRNYNPPGGLWLLPEFVGERETQIEAGTIMRIQMIEWWDGAKWVEHNLPDLKVKTAECQNSVYPIVLRVATRYQRKTGATVDLQTLEITADNVEQVLTDLVNDLDDLDAAEASLGLDLRNLIARMGQFQHNDDIHHSGEDVLTHTKWVLADLASLTGGMQAERKTVVTLAALLHDLGKAYTYELIDGKHTFRKHAEKSVEIARVLLAKHREKLGGLYDRVMDLIRLHDAFMGLLIARTGAANLKYLNKFMRERVYLDKHLDDLLTLSKADSRRAQRYEDSLRDALGVLDDIAKVEAQQAEQEAAKARQQAAWMAHLPEVRTLLEAEFPAAAAALPDRSAVYVILDKAKRLDLITKLKGIK